MRPEVRIIDHQQEEIKPADISQSEAEALLAKYGYGQSNNTQIINNPPKSEETFEEMVRREEEKKRNHNRPIIPQRNDGYTSETKWGSDSESGLNFKIEIVTDMKIPK
jgi:hypothetical protein